MKTPAALQPLVDDGLIDEVLRQLMSGKEAAIFVVRSHGELRCAKAYKDLKSRSFQSRAEYQEGRLERSSRRARAMSKGTKFGRQEMEQAWQSAEVDALYKLAGAGVRVPQPYLFDHGVLLMELVTDGAGEVAPRLIDLVLTEQEARTYHDFLIRQIVKMLCAGMIHGDLSEYNVLVGTHGPVIIDLPQAISAAANNNAKRLFERDVEAMAMCLGRWDPALKTTDYGKEIWELFEQGTLHPDSPLTGKFTRVEKAADVGAVLREIEDARAEALRRAAGR
jgi:RIO kinase 1